MSQEAIERMKFLARTVDSAIEEARAMMEKTTSRAEAVALHNAFEAETEQCTKTQLDVIWDSTADADWGDEE